MAFMYSVNREKISLTPSPDDIAVRFTAPEAARTAVAAFSAAHAVEEAAVPAYRSIVLLRDAGAAAMPFSAVRSALPAAEAGRAERSYPVYREDSSGLRLVATEEITVRFRTGVTAAQRNRALRDLNLTVRHASEFVPQQFLVTPAGPGGEWPTLDLANALSERADLVEWAAPNFLSEYQKTLLPNDPLLQDQWYLKNTGRNGALPGEDVDADLAWEITPGGSPDVVIAIIDDGVDIDHPDLKANIWVNPTVDAPDRHGRNFFDGSSDPRPRSFRDPWNDVRINDIHGTPCAGIAAAVGENGEGGVGIAYRCRILPVKIFGAPLIAAMEDVANAVRYAGRHAHVISCSWYTASHPDLESAIGDVVQTGRGGKGCPLFCATGNDHRNSIQFPASHPQTIAVGASNDQGKRSRYSNYGPGIDVVAPSEDEGRNGVTTTDISQPDRGYSLATAYVPNFSGTSAATPLAAGIAALMLSVNPNLTWAEVRDLLRSTAEKIDQQGGTYRDGYSLHYGYGRVNAHQAVLAAQAA
jgi:subtilisin family serine protease